MIGDSTRHPGPLWVVFAAAVVVLAAVLAGVAAYRTSGLTGIADYDEVRALSTNDFRDYWYTARHFRETGEITTDFGVHNYLPFFTIFMLPWSLLPLPVAAGAFAFLSVALFGVGVGLVEMLLNQTLGRRPRRAVLVGAGLMAAYVVSCGVLGAIDLFVLFLVLLTWVLFEQRQEYAGGVTLGLAILIKLVPAALLPLFLLQRRWRVVGGAAAAGLLGGLGLPLASLGWNETVDQHRAYFERAVAGHSARSTILDEKPQKAKYSNNALPIVLRRLLTPINSDPRPDRPGFTVNVVDLPRQAVYWLYLVLMAGMLTVSLWATIPHPRAWPPEHTHEINRIRAQFGVWCCLMIIAAPLVWTRYLLFAFWPLAWCADRGERAAPTRDRFTQVVAGVALLAWLLGAASLAWPPARAAGAQLGATLVLWAAMVLFTRRSVSLGDFDFGKLRREPSGD